DFLYDNAVRIGDRGGSLLLLDVALQGVDPDLRQRKRIARRPARSGDGEHRQGRAVELRRIRIVLRRGDCPLQRRTVRDTSPDHVAVGELDVEICEGSQAVYVTDCHRTSAGVLCVRLGSSDEWTARLRHEERRRARVLLWDTRSEAREFRNSEG